MKMGENSVTLYAQWVRTYTTTYNDDEHTSGIVPVDGNSPYYENTSVTVMGKGTLEKEGYTFGGWTDDGGTNYAAGSNFNITQNMNFTAVWNINKYDFEFNSRGGSDVDKQVIDHGNTASAPNPEPTYAGYSFNGWYISTDFEVQWNFCDSVTTGRTVYAQWLADTDTPYTVRHYQQNADDEDYTLKDEYEKYGETDTQATEDAKEYPEFTAYTDHPLWKNSGNINGDGSQVLELYYVRNEYELSFDKNTEDDVTNMPPNQTIRYDGKAQEPDTDPSYTNYSFGGWYKEAECTNEWDFDTDTVQGDTVLYAKWLINEREIEYNKGEGDVGSATDTQDAGSTFTLHSGDGFTRELFIIDGWTIDATPYLLGDLYTIPDNNVVAFAIWISDRDGDGVSDEDEEASNTNPDDPNDKPQLGTVILKLINNADEAVPDITCVLNSEPKTSVTNASGQAQFDDVSLSQHRLSLRDGNTQAGAFNVNFTRGASNTVVTDPATNTIAATVASNFLTLNVTLRQNAAGVWEIDDAYHTELITEIIAQQIMENPSTGEDEGSYLWLTIIILAVLLAGSSVVYFRYSRRGNTK